MSAEGFRNSIAADVMVGLDWQGEQAGDALINHVADMILISPEMQQIKASLRTLAASNSLGEHRSTLRRHGLPVHVVDWVLS